MTTEEKNRSMATSFAILCFGMLVIFTVFSVYSGMQTRHAQARIIEKMPVFRAPEQEPADGEV